MLTITKMMIDKVLVALSSFSNLGGNPPEGSPEVSQEEASTRDTLGGDHLYHRASRAASELRLCAQFNDDQDKRTQSQGHPCPAPKVAPQVCLQLAAALDLAVLILQQIDAVHTVIKEAQGATNNSCSSIYDGQNQQTAS